ncbi:MAG TPA: trypsin-like peptidase domain-containing protein [Pseudonocardia sp.]|uniref:S1C family serine protease n=1 Tax=Pseudonocardia sp. TaxID=60912 RepID=UPI002C3C0680|nr:trypsin-like peptidase domain-containing protein [Pseudonocardia sp.]HTF51213.1 trypsin-like peptidase domain-containing protein [Pseudonocardia sp.]
MNSRAFHGRFRTRIALAAVVGVCLLGVAACAQHGSQGSTAQGQAAGASEPAAPPLPSTAPQLQDDYQAVVARVLPSVVQITTDQGLGSGVVFDKQGDIVTNDHVVGNAQHFQVRLSSSPTSVPASLVGAYPPDDLAVIKLDQPPASLVPATFGNSAQLRIGAIVLALGNPLGLSGSVTEGIISATGRTVSEPRSADSPGATLPDVLQTSAAINPGNSGGALVDLSGQVIGVPTLAALDQQVGGGAAPGIGFAIPSSLVSDIAGQIVHNGHVIDSHRAALGVGVVTVIDSAGQPGGAGVASATPGGPAATAGIQPGSVITQIGGQPVHSDADLTKVLAGMQPGQQVPVVLNDPQTGSNKTITVTLGQLPGS